MKLSDYVALFLLKKGIKHVFSITGGAAAHLIDSIAKTDGIDYICTQHEQAGAMAADAYARVNRNLGASIVTSGPGATNLLTGVCCAYYDSVPVIYITGQVSTFRMKRDLGIRQLGFQETDVVDIFKPVTKYAVLVEDPLKIRYELEKAVYIAKSGRPGPVLVDIPDNLQRMNIEPENLESFIPPEEKVIVNKSEDDINKCLQLISGAKRPVLVLGFGVNLADCDKEMRELIDRLGFPVVLTWAMMFFLPADHPLKVGSFGTHGSRYGNFTVQNADLIISIGARLDTRGAGSPITTFAREAKKIIIDIDIFELKKFEKLGLKVDLLIQADAGEFVKMLSKKLRNVNFPDISEWKNKISEWKLKYPICSKEYYKEKDVNPYVFTKVLSKESSEGDIIFVDTGCGVAWVSQGFDFKEKQRYFSAFNNTPMGYALPASIGASFALGKKPVICISGDGGLQMNIQELATVVRHNLPIKIFLLNNHGYGMIQQTQEQWLGCRYEASTVEGGLGFPDFVKLAKAYGLKTIKIKYNRQLDKKIKEALAYDGPVFCDIEIPSTHRVVPQVVFGRPIEDSEPLLKREEFFDNMIVKPDKSSCQ